MKQYTQYIHKDDEWRILGGAQSDNADWNQNDDTKSDYIKNRTHYIEDSNSFTTTFTDVSFLNQVHYYINDGGVGGESSYAPKDGDIITFTINNHTYTEVLKIFGASSEEAVWSNDEPFYYIGNPSLFYSDTFFEDNKKPYFVYYTGTPGSAKWFFVVNETIINSTGTYNIDFSSLQNQNKQIDKTFLPYQKENNSIVLNNIETNIASGINSLAEGWNTAATGNAAHAEGYGYNNIPNKNNLWSLDIYTNNPAFILQGDNLNKTLTVIDITDFSYDIPKGSTLLAEWDSASSSGENSGVRAAAQVFTLGKLKNTFYNSDENYWIYYLEDVPEDVDLSSFSVDFPPTTGAYILGYEQIEYTDRPWAEGNYSHAEGYVTHAKGLGAHAEGNGTAALGDFSHAEGQSTTASGDYSYAGGKNTTAEYDYQTVIGKFNNNKTDTLFEVGKGTWNNRSNAFEVYLDGRATVGAAPVNNMDVATKKYVDDSLIDELPTFYISSNSASNPFVVKANEIGHYVFKPTVNSIYIKMETSGSTNRVINFNELIVFDNNPANGAEFAYCWYPASGGISRVMLIANSSLDGGIGWSGSTAGFGNYALKTYVDDAIAALPEPMIFKGSLGTGGTITSLPTASSENEGFTYKVITAGTYASQTAKIGDTFISDGTTWILIPSGDEPSGTVTSITLDATGPIVIDSNAAITTSGTRTLSHANSGVTAGTYKSVTVDAKGHVTAGSNPTEINSNLVNNTATGSLRTIGCTNDYTIGTYSFAEGRGSRAYGENSHAEGNNSYSVGSNSHAEGAYSYAKGSGAHAEGFGAKYSGISGTITSIDTTNHQVSVNFGSDLSTIYNSTVGGILSDANSYYNVSYRITNVSKNSNDNYTFTTDSVANWQVNTVLYLWLTSSALGISSHVEGQGCIAWHENTHAEGIGTITGNASQHVQGKWNAYAQNMADIVGNGTDAKHRSNAYTLDWDGNGVYAGKVTVGSGPTNNMDVATKQYVDNAISSVTPTLPNASSTVVGGIKVRYDANTYTLYMTNDGTDA